MKNVKKWSMLLATTLVLLITSTPVFAAGSPVASVFRLYNPNSGEHMYTLNSYERDNLKNHGWHYEGLSWQAPLNVGDPVYRLYNPNTGEHFYTTNASERDRVKNSGWRYEGVSWKSAGGIQVFRLFNPNTHGPGSHHYTAIPSEKDKLVKAGWRYEGVSWYGEDGMFY